MDTPKKVNRRGVTVENTNLSTTCQCVSKVKYVVVDSKGTRGAACAIVETFYDVKFASCQTNYGTYICKTCRKIFDRRESIVNSLRHVEQKLRNGAQRFVPVEVVKRLSKSPLALAVVTVSGRQTKKHHAESEGEGVAASASSKTGARTRLSYVSVDPQTEGDTGHEHGDDDDIKETTQQLASTVTKRVKRAAVKTIEACTEVIIQWISTENC